MLGHRSRWLLWAALALTSTSTVVSAQGRRADALAPLDLGAVAAHAAPTEADLRHRQVTWHRTVLDGIVEAQGADRPLVLWLYFGGPLGDC